MTKATYLSVQAIGSRAHYQRHAAQYAHACSRPVCRCVSKKNCSLKKNLIFFLILYSDIALYRRFDMISLRHHSFGIFFDVVLILHRNFDIVSAF